jgi:isopentenyl diphosphate isomerase/L-lactate dehydrogenase-like FMN-dependent dehydrogenase
VTAVDPQVLVNLLDVERLVERKIQVGAHGYFAGGAGDERTLRDNREAFARYRLLPRVLVDVSEVSTATTVLGTKVDMPVLVAPTALQRMAHPDGEPAMARAAAGAGTIMIVSTLATTTLRDVAQAAPAAPRWLQVYVLKDRGVTRAMIDEAVACGYEALVLTVDAPGAGHRERDTRNGFVVPEGLDMPGVTAAAGRSAGYSPHAFFELVDKSLTWRDLEALVAECEVPVLVKGIHTAADARLAVEHGVAGVIVSNHGGRQLDGVPAAIDLLEPVIQEVGGETEVLLDGGVRRGTDVLVALALGARAVLVGRPPLWGLAWDGEAGARWVLDTLRDEVALGLTLLGAPTPTDVTRAHVQTA